MDNGRIKLHRKLLERERYDDINTTRLFLHLLLIANHKEKKRKGITIGKGQLVTGRISLAEQTGLSEQQIRTSLSRLKSTSDITIKSTNKYSLITLCNWDKYQDSNYETTSKSTSKLTNNQPATNHKQECKECKENNISSKDFEKLRKQYPHARKGKKKNSKRFVQESGYTMQEYSHGLRLLNWEIIFGLQDPQYVPAAERRFRDFVPIPKHIEDQKLRQMYLIFKSSSTLQEKYREDFVKDWGLERLQNLRKEIRLEEQEAFIQSVKNAK